MGILNVPNTNKTESNNLSLNLVKGQKIDLTKGNPGLDKIRIGLGWDASEIGGVEFDLDAEVLMLNSDGKISAKENIIYYNNKTSLDKAIHHMGDNRTGEGDGDDEVIEIQLSKIDKEIDKLIFTVTIYDAENRKQNYGQVSNAYIRIENGDTGEELLRYDLSEDYSTSISMIMGKVYRHNGEWKFEATGTGSTHNLSGLINEFS